MSIEEIIQKVQRLMLELQRRDMRPVHLFVDRHTHLAIRCWATRELFVPEYTGPCGKAYFNGLEMHEVYCVDRLIVVAP